MAPEQAGGQKGKAKPASDQYSLGVVLYELLTGKTPFAGPPAIVLYNVIHHDPKPPRQMRRAIPRDLETICLKAMAKRPEDRYADCRAFAEDLRRWMDDEPIQARRSSWPERIARTFRKEPRLALIGAIILVCIALVFVVQSIGNAQLAVMAQQEREARELAEQKEREAGLNAENARANAILAQEQAQKAKQANEKFLAETERVKGALEKAQEEAKKARDAEQKAEEEAMRAREAEKLARAAEKKALEAINLLDEEKLKAALAELETARKRYAGNIQEVVTALGQQDFATARRVLNECPVQVRSWEWYHLNLWVERKKQPSVVLQKPAPDLNPVTGVPNTVIGVAAAISPNARWGVSPALEGFVKLWDLSTQKELPPFRFKGLLNDVVFTPDNKLVVYSLMSESTICVWDVEAGKMKAHLKGHRHPVNSLAVSKDGKWLVSGSSADTINKPGELKVWDLEAGKEKWNFTGHARGVSAVAIHPDGTRLASGGSDGTIHLWDLDLGKERFVYRKHKGMVTSVAFEPTRGEVIASSAFSLDLLSGDTRIWTAATGEDRAVLKDLIGMIYLCWTPDGKRLLAPISTQGVIGVIDPRNGQKLFGIPVGEQDAPWSLRFNTDGRSLLTRTINNGIYVLEADAPR